MFKLMGFVILNAVLAYLISANVNANELPNDSDPCMCLTTMELMPVCGTDGITYDTKGSLECMNKCNKATVEVLHSGRCNIQEE